MRVSVRSSQSGNVGAGTLQARNNERGQGEAGTHTTLGPAGSAVAAGDGIAGAHEQLAKTAALPGRKDEDAGEVVGVPGELLFAEEANELGLLPRLLVLSLLLPPLMPLCWRRCRWSRRYCRR